MRIFMQIVNYFQARFCNSSYAALELARNNAKYAGLAEKIVSVKQSKACWDLIISHSDERKGLELKYKINKYNFVLKQISAIKNRNDKNHKCNAAYCTRL